MKSCWAARVAVLAFCVFVGGSAAAQSTQQSKDRGTDASLGQNYPNPFRRETTIPFSLGGGASCTDPGREYRVTLRIYNLLAQAVAFPVLQGGSAGASVGQPLREAIMGCGSYTAFWDGLQSGTGREVGPGMYLYSLEVDGRRVVKRMVLVR